MTEYGVQPTGYVRKPLSVILSEIEASMVTEFGPGVIQTPQSPFGQLNGLFADFIAELDEANLDLYQSYDPDQAEGNRLDALARIRLVNRNQLSDSELRRIITNEGQSHIDLQDITQAVRNIEGVSYVNVFTNDTGEFTIPELQNGSVAVAVIGGDDSLIAETIRRYIVPGMNTFGNTLINSNVDGFCRSFSIIRPVDVTVNLNVTVRITNDKQGCPPPSLTAIKESLLANWDEQKTNGQNVSYYNIRKLVEREFSNVEVVSVNGVRDGANYLENETIPVTFMEMASLQVTVTIT